MPILQIVIGSTRPGRVGESVANWFAGRATQHGGFDVEVIDLAEVNLPLLDEPHHPRLGQYEHEHTREWSRTIARGDAYVFVNPEYNHGMNAALKNAIDFLHAEWQHKPVSFVSYGGISAGTRAVQQLKQVVLALKMTPLTESVNIPFVKELISEDGRFEPGETTDRAATAMLDELVRVEAATRTLRPETAPA